MVSSNTRRVAISYRRVSTGRQANEGHSLATQSDLIGKYCNNKRYRLQAAYEDAGRSGRTTDQRPGLHDAINAACAEGGVLVVYSISRLARSIVDASRILKELKDHGADLAVVDSDISTAGPYGKLVFNIMSSMAEFESDLIGERVRASVQRLKQERGYSRQGSQPLGWGIDGNGDRVEVAAEQDVLRKVRDAKQNRTYQAAAEVLNKMNVPTVRQLRGLKPGKKNLGWLPGTVHRVLAR